MAVMPAIGVRVAARQPGDLPLGVPDLIAEGSGPSIDFFVMPAYPRDRLRSIVDHLC